MGESVNPIEVAIADLANLARIYQTDEQPYEEGIGDGLQIAIDGLLDAIKPYLPQPGPPTEPGEYRMTFVGRNEPFVWIVTKNDLDGGIIWFDEGSALVQHIAWHCRIMPPFGEVGE